jgi:hypothetical protein
LVDVFLAFGEHRVELTTIVRNRCRTPATGPDGPTFDIVTTANPKQRRAPEPKNRSYPPPVRAGGGVAVCVFPTTLFLKILP